MSFDVFLYRQKPRSIHAKYYTFLPKKDIVDYNKKEEFKLIKFPLFFNPRLLRFVFRDIKKDTRLELTENPMKDAVTLEKMSTSGLTAGIVSLTSHCQRLYFHKKTNTKFSRTSKF